MCNEYNKGQCDIYCTYSIILTFVSVTPFSFLYFLIRSGFTLISQSELYDSKTHLVPEICFGNSIMYQAVGLSQLPFLAPVLTQE